MGGAGNGIRTRDFQLGKLTLYQLSYARGRKNNNQRDGVCKGKGRFQGLNSRFVIANRYLSGAIPRLPPPFGPRNDTRSNLFIAPILRSMIETPDSRR